VSKENSHIEVDIGDRIELPITRVDLKCCSSCRFRQPDDYYEVWSCVIVRDDETGLPVTDFEMTRAVPWNGLCNNWERGQA